MMESLSAVLLGFRGGRDLLHGIGDADLVVVPELADERP
jgi:hypothetical protein